MRPIAILRPEPGNTATARLVEAAGRTAIRLPLFAVRALAWTPPPTDAHDALVLTSANAVRAAGPGLARFAALPAYVVGAASARAAQAAGLNVVATGSAGMAALLAGARAAGVVRALHIAGRDRTLAEVAPVTRTVEVYASEPVPVAAADLARLDGSVALLHSRRAALRLAALVEGPARARIALVAIAEPTAIAAGPGWQTVATAAAPGDAALLARALALAD